MMPDQDPQWDSDWDVRLWMAGRGGGKTRAGAEAVREAVWTGLVKPGQMVGIVGRTYEAARDVMIYGESGLLNVGHPSQRPVWRKSERLLMWPNGVVGRAYSAEQPDSLRGPQFGLIWADEPAAWSRLEHPDNSPWENMLMANREVGALCRILATTTPRGTRFMRDLVKDPRTLHSVWPTYRNAANLSEQFIRRVVDRFEGTRLGEQEIHGKLLDEAAGALFQREWLTGGRGGRVAAPGAVLEPRRVVVGVDPPGSEFGAYCGIVVAAMAADRRLEVWDDMSIRGSPGTWGAQVVSACRRWGTKTVVVERNFGGDMARHTLRTVDGGSRLEIHEVTAKVGKRRRAEPVAGRFQTQTARLCGDFPELEDEMCLWTEDDDYSPDRMDAMVWAMRHLDPQLAQSVLPDGWGRHSEFEPSRWTL